ncbi:hypothetical protein C1638_013985 [Chryseobacterium oncorhynchi]|uniref:Uncharacterized protein n=1 Tax=Chryseobacterium oncorhynchi TaxID=741074 RepID=A0A316WS73_9FLAO|nr:hypothetical protein C1638_013985 [Chryseobacterium oncorhynchi]
MYHRILKFSSIIYLRLEKVERLLFKKRVQVPKIICENLPLYGVVVVVVNVETEDMPEIGNFRAEISDMFLKKFIVVKQMYKLFWNNMFLT